MRINTSRKWRTMKTKKSMLDQRAVDQWLDRFVRKLKDIFGYRLLFVGLHGSWARGEGKTESDIDITTVLDRVNTKDLRAFRNIIVSMPNAKNLASGGLYSIAEEQAKPRFEGAHLFYEYKVLYGTLDDIIKKPNPIDLLGDVRFKASSNLFIARNYLIYPHDPRKVVGRLHYPFKCCFFGLQSWILLCEGRFVALKDDLINALTDADDRVVVRIVRDWRESEEDREKRPLYYIELLERWSKKMLLRVQAYETTERNENSRT